MSDAHIMTPGTAVSEQDSATTWADALAEFEQAIRGDGDFVPAPIDGPDGLGPMPVELREHAEHLLAACLARVLEVQAEIDEIGDELESLRRRSAPRGAWTDDAQGSMSGAGHLV